MPQLPVLAFPNIMLELLCLIISNNIDIYYLENENLLWYIYDKTTINNNIINMKCL